MGTMYRETVEGCKNALFPHVHIISQDSRPNSPDFEECSLPYLIPKGVRFDTVSTFHSTDTYMEVTLGTFKKSVLLLDFDKQTLAEAAATEAEKAHRNLCQQRKRA